MQSAWRWLNGMLGGSAEEQAAEQGVEADEAGRTMELRSLTPVFGGPDWHPRRPA
jgi:hypothetical protein